MISIIPYIGGKHRMAKVIADRLHSTGADTLVDVFGGSAAVILNAGFSKRVYNDANDDLCNLFRVLAEPHLRKMLHDHLRWTPISRRIFLTDYQSYLSGCFSFRTVEDPIERARKTLYRHLLSWGGKMRSGGFSISTGDRHVIKEVKRYSGVLQRLDLIGDFFLGTVIECLDYQDAIKAYGGRHNVVLFCDPPYDGTEHYYSSRFARADHVFLSHLLGESKAQVVITYYDTPLIRELYPEERWNWERIQATKNAQFRSGNSVKSDEYIITRK